MDDETWVHCNTPQCNLASMEWRHYCFPVNQEIQGSYHLLGKWWLSCFEITNRYCWSISLKVDWQLLQLCMVQHGKYITIKHTFSLWADDKKLLLLDSARLYPTHSDILATFPPYSPDMAPYDVLLYPPPANGTTTYSPDLAESDFHLFPDFKEHFWCPHISEWRGCRNINVTLALS